MVPFPSFNHYFQSVIQKNRLHFLIFLKVLARFEGFPTKKLEALRTAAALYLKLDTIVYQLQNWKFFSPAGQLLDRVESYFTKVICYAYLDLLKVLI